MNDDKIPKYGNTSIGTDPSLLKKIETLDITPPTETKDPNAKPITKKEKDKKKNNIFMIIIVCILIFAVGGGLFFYLRIGTNGGLHKVGTGTAEEISEDKDVKANNIVYVTGYKLSNDVTDYVTFKKNTDKTCKLDVSNVDITKAGDYKYSVTCDSIKYTATITVIDKNTVSYTTYLVYNVSGTDPAISNFISGENTKYTFNDALPTEPSTLNAVSINGVTDDETAYTAYGLLYILPSTPKEQYICRKLSGNEEINYRFVVDESDNLMDNTLMITKYTYTDELEYYKLVSTIKKGEITIDGKTGLAIVNNNKKEISLVEQVSKTNLDDEAGGELPTAISEITQIYTDKGYICN